METGKKDKQIFISYSRRDRRIVDNVIERLKKEGFNIWIDREGIESGDAFRGKIVDAINDVQIVIFFSSKSSNLSTWTKKEILISIAMDKHIIPVKLDLSDYNKDLLFDLIDLDYVNLSDDSMYDEEINRLCKTLKNKLSLPSNISLDQSIEYTKEKLETLKRRLSSKEILEIVPLLFRKYEENTTNFSEIIRQNKVTSVISKFISSKKKNNN